MIERRSDLKSDWLFILMLISLPLQAIGFELVIQVNISLVIALLFTVSHLKYLRLRNLGGADVWYVLFLIWAIISVFYNWVFLGRSLLDATSFGLLFSPLRWFIHLGRLFFAFFFFRVLTNFLSERREMLPILFRTFRIVVIAVLLYATYQVFGLKNGWPYSSIANLYVPGLISTASFGGSLSLVRPYVTFNEPRGYATFLIMAIPLIVGWSIAVRSGSRNFLTSVVDRGSWLDVLLIMGMLFNLLLASSRAGSLAFIVEVFAYGLFYSWRAAVSMFGALLVVGSLIFTFQGGGALNGWSNFIDSYSSETDTPYYTQQSFVEAWPLFLSEPVLGYGPGGFVSVTGAINLNPLQELRTADAVTLVGYLISSAGFVGATMFILFLILNFSQVLGSVRVAQTTDPSSDIATLLGSTLVAAIGTWTAFTLSPRWNELFVWFVLAVLIAFVRVHTTLQAESNERGLHTGAVGRF